MGVQILPPNTFRAIGYHIILLHLGTSIYHVYFQVAYKKSRSRLLNNNFKKQVKRGSWDNQKKTEYFIGIKPNAAYDYLENKVYVPSWAMDGWIFNDLRPKILNIPTMSFLMAHEIFHGFDSEGHEYDHKGWYSTKI